VVGAERSGRQSDLGQRGPLHRLVDYLPLDTSSLEFMHFNEIRGTACERPVPDRVDVELHPANVLILGALVGLEIHHGYLAGVRMANQIDPSIDDDAVAEFELDDLFGVFQLVKMTPVLSEILTDGTDRRRLESVAQLGIRERHM
jgi:hypothetical protein